MCGLGGKGKFVEFGRLRQIFNQRRRSPPPPSPPSINQSVNQSVNQSSSSLYHLLDFLLTSHQIEPMTGKSSSTSKSTKSHDKSSSKSQDRSSSKKKSGTNSISSRNTASAPQQIDLTETLDTPHSTTTIPINIPSIQHTKDLVKKITDVRKTLEECRQRRAVLDRLLAENERLLNLASPVPEASIRKHIYAQGHLLLLRREERIQHQDLSILLCFIGIILFIYIFFIDCL